MCCNDPFHELTHRVARTNDFAAVSWELGHNGSHCGQEQERITHIKEGVTFAFKRPGGYLENISLGWTSSFPGDLEPDYMAHLSALLRPMRDFHWDVHDTV